MKIDYVLTDIQELYFKKDLKEDIQLEIQTKSNYTVFTSYILFLCIKLL